MPVQALVVESYASALPIKPSQHPTNEREGGTQNVLLGALFPSPPISLISSSSSPSSSLSS